MVEGWISQSQKSTQNGSRTDRLDNSECMTIVKWVVRVKCVKTDRDSD